MGIFICYIGIFLCNMPLAMDMLHRNIEITQDYFGK